MTIATLIAEVLGAWLLLGVATVGVLNIAKATVIARARR